MYVLYISKPLSSWAMRLWVLLKELGIPFEGRAVSFLPDKQAQRQQFLEFSPTAKIPVLHDDGQVIWDSLAIVEGCHGTVTMWQYDGRFSMAWLVTEEAANGSKNPGSGRRCGDSGADCGQPAAGGA